jgi:hypothetical protein
MSFSVVGQTSKKNHAKNGEAMWVHNIRILIDLKKVRDANRPQFSH